MPLNHVTLTVIVFVAAIGLFSRWPNGSSGVSVAFLFGSDDKPEAEVKEQEQESPEATVVDDNDDDDSEPAESTTSSESGKR